MFMVANPETKQPEIIIRFANFNSEQEAIDFAHAFKSLPQYEDIKAEELKVTIH